MRILMLAWAHFVVMIKKVYWAHTKHGHEGNVTSAVALRSAHVTFPSCPCPVCAQYTLLIIVTDRLAPQCTPLNHSVAHTMKCFQPKALTWTEGKTTHDAPLSCVAPSVHISAFCSKPFLLSRSERMGALLLHATASRRFATLAFLL